MLFAFSVINLRKAISRDESLTEDEKAIFKRQIWLFGPVAAIDLLIFLRRRQSAQRRL
jgi:hypothetical protein